jgi:C-terminal processing protease CtpA/Prc
MKITLLSITLLLLSACSKNSDKNHANILLSNYLNKDNTPTPPTFHLLSDIRSEIKAPEISAEDRKLVLDQARLVLAEIYVNRLVKIADFGSQADPLPQLDTFEKDYLNFTASTFHENLAKIFASQKDSHTWYQLPGTMGCYASFFPFSLVPAKSEANADISIIKKIRTDEEIYRLIPEFKKVSIGDELISINGKKTNLAILDVNILSAGSNPGALRRKANNLLSYRSHWGYPVPKEEKAIFEFKRMDKTIYKIEMPWLVSKDNACLSSDEKMKPRFKRPAKNIAEDRYQVEYQNFYKSKSTDKTVAGMVGTIEPSIHWWVLENENGKFGVIRLDSFMPENVSPEGARDIIESLLLNEMAAFDGVIFDLRNNGGGMISYGQSLAELFTGKELDVLDFQLVNSKANFHYFSVAEPNSDFFIMLQDAVAAGRVMTRPIPLSRAEGIFIKGQAFFKPVAIFMNGGCYSTCDMMSALFQDLSIGEVWGEDLQTGAGGANNWNHNEMVRSLPENNRGDFAALPKGQAIGFAFRQTIRVGSHAGEILENAGAKADYLIPASAQDIVDNGKSQFLKITKNLALKAQSYIAWAGISNRQERDSTSDIGFLKIDFKGTDAIKVFRKDNEVAHFDVTNSTSLQTASIPLELTKNTNHSFEVIGLSAGARVWRKLTSIRQIPESLVLEASQTLAFDFKQTYLPMAIFNEHTRSINGWYLDNGALRIGSDLGYKEEVHSVASLFLDLKNKQNAVISFNLESYTEIDYDFISLEVRYENQIVNLLKPMSGAQESRNYNFDLSDFSGKKIEIRFVFTSDMGLNDKGVWLRDLVIK